MSRAVLSAALAGVCAAWALVDVAAEMAQQRGRSLLGGAALRALARIGRRAGSPAAPRALGRRLAAAGASRGLGIGDVMAVKGGAALVALVAGVPLATTLPGRLPVVAAVALPLAAFLGPDIWLARRIGRRARAMELELPDLVDLLRVALAAGLPLRRALAEAARRDSGLLAREVRTAAAELELGLAGEDVLGRLADRCPAAGTASLVAILRRAARYGAPPAEALAALARDSRSERTRRIREEAARAAPKIQLVVALGLVPSVMLLVAAALLRSLV